MYKYLKDKQYYIDLYDKLTVDHCRRMKRLFNNADCKESKADSSNVFGDIAMPFIVGEEYLRKEKTINKWMDRDRTRDELLKTAPTPKAPICQTCGNTMRFDLKALHGDNDTHVLFFFSCENNHKGRAFLETGEEYIPQKHLCPKCKLELKSSTKRRGGKLIIIQTCPCGYKDEMALGGGKEERPDPDFEKDRGQYCLTKEKGQEYLSAKYHLESAAGMVKEYENRDKNKELYSQVDCLQKLTLPQLKKFIESRTAKTKFSSLHFSSPQMNRHVIVEFTMEDTDDNRQEFDSKKDCRKLFEDILYNTNWNLMSEGISYRMGVLSGRLKALESKEDLLEKIKTRKPLPKGKVFGKDGIIITL